MKLPRTVAVGSDLISATMQLPIHGIVIDNPSGGWLFVVEANDFCPPYTLQWSRDLEYAGTAITVRYGQSPAGQVSTRQGDPYTVTLNSEPVGNSPGVAQQFVEQFTPVQTANTQQTINFLGFIPITIAPAIANKRYRLLAASLILDISATTGLSYDSSTAIEIFDSLGGGGNVQIPLHLTGHSQPSDHFVGEVDFPVGSGISMSGATEYANTDIILSITFQII